MKDLHLILAPFQNQPQELLEYLCKHVNGQILEKISQADYGVYADAYLKELRRIKQHSEIHSMNFDGALSEVVELTRWQKPEQTTDKWLTKAQQDNLAIAFSCAILLMVPYEWYQNRVGENSTIIRLIQSSESLQYILPKMLHHVSKLLAWRITENGTDLEEVPFFIFGLVLTLLKSGDYQEAQVEELVAHLLIIEKTAFEAISNTIFPTSSHWLFRITSYHQLQKDWQSFQPFLIEQIDKVKSEALKAKLQQVADLLA
ncbi:MAG TPA: hypothetical protein PKA00_22950 [Saprospiraceae bacterium]|nr:hypothetical protein [Saprospiraceae bacterium]HMQ85787.1 hypothetical protein [Saprospiraceae bacterium]